MMKMSAVEAAVSLIFFRTVTFQAFNPLTENLEAVGDTLPEDGGDVILWPTAREQQVGAHRRRRLPRLLQAHVGQLDGTLTAPPGAQQGQVDHPSSCVRHALSEVAGGLSSVRHGGCVPRVEDADDGKVIASAELVDDVTCTGVRCGLRLDMVHSQFGEFVVNLERFLVDSHVMLCSLFCNVLPVRVARQEVGQCRFAASGSDQGGHFKVVLAMEGDLSIPRGGKAYPAYRPVHCHVVQLYEPLAFVVLVSTIDGYAQK